MTQTNLAAAEEAAATAPGAGTEAPLLEVRHLKKYFPVKKSFWGKPLKFLRAVDDVSFTVNKGRTLGIVGESGCGKTTMGRTILRLYDITGGEILFKGKEVGGLPDREFDKLRPNMQMIFQMPAESFDPRYTLGSGIGESLRNAGMSRKETQYPCLPLSRRQPALKKEVLYFLPLQKFDSI